VAYAPGPFDRKHHLLVWGGTLPGDETWCCSLRLAGTSGISEETTRIANDLWVDSKSDEDRQSWLDDDIAPAVLTYHTAAGTGLHPNAKLTYCKLNPIGIDGHYLSETTIEHVFPPAPGGGPANNTPNQVALVVSLTTGFTRGPAHRGRFFLPMPSMNMGGVDGCFSDGAIDNCVLTTKTFLEEIADVPGLDTVGSAEPAVMSRKLGSPKTRKVTGVAIGRVPDTQRRRRRNIPEDYQVTGTSFGTF